MFTKIIEDLKKACANAMCGELNNVFIPRKALCNSVSFSWRELLVEVSKLPLHCFEMNGNKIVSCFWYQNVKMEVAFVIRKPEESTQFALYYIHKCKLSKSFANELVSLRTSAKQKNAKSKFNYSVHYYKDRLINPLYNERNVVVDATFLQALAKCKACSLTTQGNNRRMVVLLSTNDIIQKYGSPVYVVLGIRSYEDIHVHGLTPYNIVTMFPENKQKFANRLSSY